MSGRGGVRSSARLSGDAVAATTTATAAAPAAPGPTVRVALGRGRPVATTAAAALRRARAAERAREVEDSPRVLRDKCRRLARALRNAKHLVVYTGAGISTAADIPDYRGPDGVWTRLQRGETVGRVEVSRARPTFTHMALTALWARGALKFVVSQNCDGLHLRAGLPRRALAELHGDMFAELCAPCRRVYLRAFDTTERTARHQHGTRRLCHACGAELHDSIVHFGERGRAAWPLNWAGALRHAARADVVLCLGSSLKVLRRYPRLWRMQSAPRARPALYIVNLQWTPKDSVAALKINARCDAVMQQVARRLRLRVPRYRAGRDPVLAHAEPLAAPEHHTTRRPLLRAPPEPEDSASDEWEPSSPSASDSDEELPLRRLADRLRGPLPDRIRGPPDRLRGLPPDRIQGPPPDRLRGPIPDLLRLPVPSCMRGSVSDRLRGPVADRLRGPVPDRLRGPIPDLRGSLPQRMCGPIPNQLRGSSPVRLCRPVPNRLWGPASDRLRGPPLDRQCEPITNRPCGPASDRLHFPRPKLGSPYERLRVPAPDRLRGPFPDRLRGPCPDRLRGPCSDRLHGPPSDHLNGPPPYHLNGPPPDLLNGPSDRLCRLSPDLQTEPVSERLSGLVPDRLRRISPDRVRRLPPDRVRRLPPDRVRRLPPDHIRDPISDRLNESASDRLRSPTLDQYCDSASELCPGPVLDCKRESSETPRGSTPNSLHGPALERHHGLTSDRLRAFQVGLQSGEATILLRAEHAPSPPPRPGSCPPRCRTTELRSFRMARHGPDSRPLTINGRGTPPDDLRASPVPLPDDAKPVNGTAGLGSRLRRLLEYEPRIDASENAKRLSQVCGHRSEFEANSFKADVKMEPKIEPKLELKGELKREASSSDEERGALAAGSLAAAIIRRAVLLCRASLYPGLHTIIAPTAPVPRPAAPCSTAGAECAWCARHYSARRCLWYGPPRDPPPSARAWRRVRGRRYMCACCGAGQSPPRQPEPGPDEGGWYGKGYRKGRRRRR